MSTKTLASHRKKPQTLRVATVQFESQPGDKACNFAVIESFVRKAARQGARLVVFPECCVTGYWFLRNLTRKQLGQLAEPIPDGPTSRRLLALARSADIAVGAGWIEAGKDGVFHNSYVVALPDGRLRRHRKLHAFEHPAIEGGSEFTVFDLTDGWRVGVLICYDCNLIENVRLTALQGAEILVAPHQTGGCRTRNPHLMGVIDRGIWERRHEDPQAIRRELRGDKGRAWLMRWLPSRAHDNGLFLVFSNGIGVDDDEIRTGNAMILDPYGRILKETSKAGDAMVVADLDARLLPESTGQVWMRARRPELYSPLAMRTGREQSVKKLKFSE